MFKKNNKDIKLETSREIEKRISKSDLSTSHSVLQSDLVKLLCVSTGRRDQTWNESYCSLRDQCITLDIWEGFNIKYNLHRGYTANLCQIT